MRRSHDNPLDIFVELVPEQIVIKLPMSPQNVQNCQKVLIELSSLSRFSLESNPDKTYVSNGFLKIVPARKPLNASCHDVP